MKINNVNNEGNGTITERSTSSAQIIVTIILLLVIVLVVVFMYVYYMSLSKESGSSMSSDEQFSVTLQEGGRLLTSGNAAEATAQFNKLLEQAETPVQEGVAKLNLAVSRLKSNREEAVAMLKEVSVNTEYQPFTRAKATNYILNEYTATKDAQFATEHIFTGPTWGEFMREDESLDDAALRGYEFSALISPTPEGSMRIAAETAFKMWRPETTEEERDAYAEKVLVYIGDADNAIESLTADGRIQYGDTHYSEIATAYNRKGMALDVLYFLGYVDDPQMVEDAFQDALNILIENGTVLGTELFIRYHYSDFLVRLDAEGRQESIAKILTPMEQMTTNNNAATFFRNRLENQMLYQAKAIDELARPDNIVRLANISPEFRSALLRIGVSEASLNN